MLCKILCVRRAVSGHSAVCLTLPAVVLLLTSFVPSRAASAAIPGLLASPSSARQTPQTAPPDAVPLELNVALDRELTVGQKHEYQMMLVEGQYANVKVEQRGIDVTVR